MTPDSDWLQASREATRRFLAAPIDSRFVIGRGAYAQSLASVVPVSAFVDDFYPGRTFANRPVITMDQLPEDSISVAATMLRPLTTMRELASRNRQGVDYFSFSRFCKLPILPVAHWTEFRSDYKRNRPRYEAIRQRLRDAESRLIWDSIIRFRLESDLSAMVWARFDPEEQYWGEFLKLKDQGECFVDVGSFDGATSLAFARRVPGFRHITAMEPSPLNAERVRSSLAHLDSGRVTILEAAAGERSATARMTSTLGSASALSAEGDARVSLVALDDCEFDDVTYVKMDIEGGEIPAIRGSLATLRKHRPRLAIAVYHRATDLWAVPEAVDKAGVDYRLVLRHYTEGIDETVLYFLPNDADT